MSCAFAPRRCAIVAIRILSTSFNLLARGIDDGGACLAEFPILGCQLLLPARCAAWRCGRQRRSRRADPWDHPRRQLSRLWARAWSYAFSSRLSEPLAAQVSHRVEAPRWFGPPENRGWGFASVPATNARCVLSVLTVRGAGRAMVLGPVPYPHRDRRYNVRAVKPGCRSHTSIAAVGAVRRAVPPGSVAQRISFLQRA